MSFSCPKSPPDSFANYKGDKTKSKAIKETEEGLRGDSNEAEETMKKTDFFSFVISLEKS